MDNSLPFSSSNANSVQEQHSMEFQKKKEQHSMDLNNSQFTSFQTYDHMYANVACPAVMSHQPPQIPFMPTGSEFGPLICNRGAFFDPHMTKMARINRKKAMIRSRNNPSPNSGPSDLADSKRQVMFNMRKPAEIAPRQDFYRYSTFNNKKLKVLLVKQLQKSDCGSLGRIVLPKRESEGNLPQLHDKEGIILEMRDADSVNSFSFRYKFWSNNKSRMYVLENTGDFVKKNGVQTGDLLTIYEDESKNLYFSITKSNKKNGPNEVQPMEVNEPNYFGDLMFDYQPVDEEEASIEMLIGNLNNHYPIPDDLMSLTPYLEDHASPSSLPQDDPSNGYHVSLDDFDDFGW